MTKSITRRILPALLAALLLATALPALAAPLSGNAGLPAQLAALVGQAEATRLLSTSDGTAQAISLLRASGAIVPQQGFTTVQRPAPELTELEKAIADLRKAGAIVHILKADEKTDMSKGDYFVFDEKLYWNQGSEGNYHLQFSGSIFYLSNDPIDFRSLPDDAYSTQIYPKPNK